MFKFFTQKNGFYGVFLDQLFILISTWYQVQLDVKINEWFGEFYDTLQKALTTPNSVSEKNLLVIFLHLQKLLLYGF
jgi:peptide/bleomycin uptake transporter